MHTVDPKEIRRSIVNDDDEIWQDHNIEVEVSRFDYGSGNKNPLLNIPFYKKSSDGKLDAKLLKKDELPADLPQRLVDFTLRIYTKVPKLDPETIEEAKKRALKILLCKTKLQKIHDETTPLKQGPSAPNLTSSSSGSSKIHRKRRSVGRTPIKRKVKKVKSSDLDSHDSTGVNAHPAVNRQLDLSK